MKKTLLLVTLILAVASIFIIGIFASAAGQTLITVKVTSVEFDHSEEEVIETNGVETRRIRIEEGITSYQLKWTVYPVKDEETGKEGATNQNVTFSSNNDLVTVSSDGKVTFPKTLTNSLSVVITIKTDDGDYTDTISFFIKHTNSSVITD